MVVFYSRLRDIGPRDRHGGADPAHVVQILKCATVLINTPPPVNLRDLLDKGGGLLKAYKKSKNQTTRIFGNLPYSRVKCTKNPQNLSFRRGGDLKERRQKI